MENSRYKFRAWEKSTEEMIPVATIDFEKQLINTNGPWRFFKEIELMQYTGLKDKNGVEIYEGDIVTASFWDDEQKIYSETAIVDFEEGSFILKLSNDEWSYFNGTQSFEVIGNIHEHPNLLEVSTV